MQYSSQASNGFASTNEEEVVRRLPRIPFPGELQRLVDAEIPFVLTVGAEQWVHVEDAVVEPNPVDGAGTAGQAFSAFSVLQLLLAKSVGTPYRQSTDRVDGMLLDVVPRDDQLDMPNTSAGSREPFDFHTDKSCTADRDERPDWVTLACVRNSEGARTSVAPVQKLCEMLDRSQLQTLAEPAFAFGSDGGTIGPIVSASDRGWEIRLSTDMTPLDPAAESAYRALRHAARAAADDVALEPGHILFLPNRTCVHGREAFSPDPDPRLRRRLQRIYIRRDGAVRS